MSGSTSTLWIGDLEPAMDEYFVKQAFTIMGENPLHIKIIRNKMTGLSRGYGFLEFGDEETAQRALLQCNGKPIPNAVQPKMFRLNHANSGAGNGGGPRSSNGRSQFGSADEFSMFVGDLSAEVDDLLLYHAFSTRYPSVRAAKVVLDQNGLSKGFGFVRFGMENEYQGALVEMQNSLIVGSKPIRVGVATPRSSNQRRDYQDQYSYSNQRIPREQYSGGAERRRIFYRNPSSFE